MERLNKARFDKDVEKDALLLARRLEFQQTLHDKRARQLQRGEAMESIRVGHEDMKMKLAGVASVGAVKTMQEDRKRVLEEHRAEEERRLLRNQEKEQRQIEFEEQERERIYFRMQKAEARQHQLVMKREMIQAKRAEDKLTRAKSAQIRREQSKRNAQELKTRQDRAQEFKRALQV